MDVLALQNMAGFWEINEEILKLLVTTEANLEEKIPQILNSIKNLTQIIIKQIVLTGIILI